jgi:UDPglucose 6-dehydrogenase
MQQLNVTVIGAGYVGIVTGACLSYLGHRVVCVDTDAGKIGKLLQGESPIFEPFLENLLALAKSRGGIEFAAELTAAVASSDVIFIAVGTPPGPAGEPNLEYLEAAARSIGRAMDDSRFRVVVNKSTVPVGCGNLVETLIQESLADMWPSGWRQVHFGVASNPASLREGCAEGASLYPDRIIIGASDSRTREVMCALYQPLIEQSFDAPAGMPRPAGLKSVPFLATSLTSAEMIKYAANAFLAMKIGFANEMANICERVGAEATEVMTGIGMDTRIGARFLNAGIGWGGSCFGKDNQALIHTAQEYGYDAKLLKASLEVNCDQREVVIRKLQEKLRILKGRAIGLLGLAFKPDTDDLRDAPSLSIAARLAQMGARVRAYDPVAMDACRRQHPDLKLRYCDSPQDLAADADALVVVTEWREFLQLDLAALAASMATPVLVDGRNLFDPGTAVAAGFDYAGIGRGGAIHRADPPRHASSGGSARPADAGM